MDIHIPLRTSRRMLVASLIAVEFLAACSSAVPDQSAAPGLPALDETVPDEMPSGVWVGTVADAGNSYPIYLSFGVCRPGIRCAAVKYETFGCSGTFSYLGLDQAAAVFQEEITVGQDQCFSGSTVRMEYLSPDDPLSLQWLAPDGSPGPMAELFSKTAAANRLPEDFGREVTKLTPGGWRVNWMPHLAYGSLWVPNGGGGTVERIDLAQLDVVASIQVGDPSRALWNMDPNAIAASGDSLWVTQRADNAVGRIDMATNALVDSIDIGVEPYDIALDGDTLWVTAFEEDTLVRVDAANGEVVAVITDISKPTGVTTGAGFVWVVEHRSGNLVQVDPATNAVVERIRLGGQVGALPENIIYAYGSLWTPNNTGKTISRIDPATLEETLIEFPKRPGRIFDTGGRIWLALWPNLGATDEFAEIVQVDPASNEVIQSVPFPPGVVAITSLGGTLIVIDAVSDVDRQTGDQVHFIELAP